MKSLLLTIPDNPPDEHSTVAWMWEGENGCQINKDTIINGPSGRKSYYKDIPKEWLSEFIKPCPFCGSRINPKNIYNENLLKGRPLWKLSCGRYCVSMRRPTRKTLIEDWNTRK